MSANIIWGENIVWGENIICSENIIWGENIIWVNTIWGENVIWGESIGGGFLIKETMLYQSHLDPTLPPAPMQAPPTVTNDWRTGLVS